MANRTIERIYLKFFLTFVSISIVFVLNACSSQDESNNITGVTANEPNTAVNTDSIANAIKDEVIKSTKDSLNKASNADSASKSNEQNTAVNIDSIANAIKDDVKKSIKDSINASHTENAENNQSATNTLIARAEGFEIEGVENIYGAFANHYAVMYEDFTFPDDNGDSVTIQTPFPVVITNICKNTTPCNQKKVFVKTWIPDFADTATQTGVVPPNDSIVLSPNLIFNNNALISLSSAKKVNREVKVFALENDSQILFHSESRPTTIHPMQVFGLESLFQVYPNTQYLLYGVWVTPMADSITNIINEVANKLPHGEIKVYQRYPEDDDINISTTRVINAVFEVLQSRNIKYVENDGAGSFGQRINYPVETLRKKQGLCIETAVLFASVLERLGYNTSLMFIPNHAFVGWLKEPKNNPSHEDYNVVETTMLGYKDKTFLEAELNALDKYYDPLGDGSYNIDAVTIVPIDTLRKYGITPNNIP